ncbi:NAD(P)H-hydrate dehydratase [bacterium]|nr:NAD(P)H-hydrate dehydratase [bacterium]
MKLLNADQMSYVDRVTIERGTPGVELMRNAGTAVFRTVSGKAVGKPGDRIVVLAGKGNNGGDGFRVAELLVRGGYRTELYLIGRKDAVSGDALTCMHDAEASGITVNEILDEKGLEKAADRIGSAEVIVDALFGTGLRGDITGLPASVIRLVNDSDSTVVAVDVPSGVNASTGEVSCDTVRADYTVTFGCLKVGHVFGPGKRKCGRITVEEIGFDPDVLDSVEAIGFSLTPSEAAQRIPERAYNAHKGDAGRVFILAGSVGLTGAATMSARAVMRVGAGLVTVGCPASLNDILEVKLTEVMTLPLPEVRRKRCLSLRALGMVRTAVERADVVAVGPGLGTYHETAELVRRFTGNYSGRIVLDADGINAFSGKAAVLADAPCEMVITPHIGELSRLTEQSVNDITGDPVRAAQEAAGTTGKIVLLKGAPTVIADQNGTVWINPTGNESMATGGMGDVLTGTIAGLAAQGMNLFDAAVLGAYVHGSAGERVSELRGMRGVIACDALEQLPFVLKELTDNYRSRRS